MRFNKILNLILVITFSKEALGVEKFYFGDLPKYLEINSKESMLFSLPSPPFSVSCQPGGVVELNVIENEKDLQIASIAQNPTLLDSFLKKNNEEKNPNIARISPLDYILKVNPLKEKMETRCAISLNNGETVSLRLFTRPGLFRPLVKFESSLSEPNPMLSVSLNYLDTFSDLIRGNGLIKFENITKDITETEKSTQLAEYKLSYVATDRNEFKAWIFAIKLKQDLDSQLSLLAVNVGEIYISTLLRSEVTKKGKFKKNEELSFYILTRSSISSKEIMEKLP